MIASTDFFVLLEVLWFYFNFYKYFLKYSSLTAPYMNSEKRSMESQSIYLPFCLMPFPYDCISDTGVQDNSAISVQSYFRIVLLIFGLSGILSLLIEPYIFKVTWSPSA